MKLGGKLPVLIAILMFPILGLTQKQGNEPVAVSLVQLLANPEQFDSKLISVTGFLGLDPPDGTLLYLHKEDHDHGILSNAVSITLSDEAWKERERLDRNYIRVVGVFRSQARSGSQVGSITELRYFRLWSQIAHPIRSDISKSRKPLPLE